MEKLADKIEKIDPSHERIVNGPKTKDNELVEIPLSETTTDLQSTRKKLSWKRQTK